MFEVIADHLISYKKDARSGIDDASVLPGHSVYQSHRLHVSPSIARCAGLLHELVDCLLALITQVLQPFSKDTESQTPLRL